MAIYSDTYGGVQQARFAEDAQRRAAGRAALAMLIDQQREATRQRERQEALAIRQMEQDQEIAYRDKLFRENARMFDEQMRVRENRRPSLTDVNRLPEATWNLTDEQTRQLYADMGLSTEQAMVAESQRQPIRQQIKAEHDAEAAAAQVMNVDPRKRAILAEQLAIAKEYPSNNSGARYLMPFLGVPGMVSALTGKNWFSHRPQSQSNISADIAAGAARQQQALDQRMQRANGLRESLVQDPRTGAWVFTTPPPAGMAPWSRRAPMVNAPPVIGTNAPVIDLPPSAVNVRPAGPVAGEMVPVVAPDGRVKLVPRIMLNQALMAGGRVAQ